MPRVLPRLALVFSLSLPPVAAQAGDINEVFLLATCAPDTGPTGKRHRIVTTPHGVGIAHRGNAVGEIIFRCQLDVEDVNAYNALVITAEDDSADASATVTLYRQAISPSIGLAPEALGSLTTMDFAGLNSTIGDLIPPFEVFSLSEIVYVYWLDVRLTRTSSAASMIVYIVGLQDVL